MGSRKIEVQIVGDASQLSRAFRTAGAEAESMGHRMGSSFARLGKAAVFGGVIAGVAGITAVLKAGSSEWEQQARVQALVEAHLQSTGNAANTTSAHIDALSQSVLSKTGADDEAVKSGSAMLLMFTKVKNGVGENRDIFDQATLAAVNLSSSMHQGDVSASSVASSAKALGRALNDPIGGLGQLARSGVKFTEGEKAQMAQLVNSGQQWKAQALIIKKVETVSKGAAEAFGKTIPGQMKIATETFRNLSSQLVGTLAPAFNVVLGAANRFMTGLNKQKGFKAKMSFVWDKTIKGIEKLASTIGGAVAAVDWGAVWSRAKGIGAGFTDAIEGIDWGATGKAIGDGIANAVNSAITHLKGLPTKITEVLGSIDWESLGVKMGPGLAAAVASAFVAITSPSFWMKHWDLALAIGLTVFGGKIGKLAGPIGTKISEMFGKAWSGVILKIATFVGKFSSDLGLLVQKGLTKLSGIAGRALASMWLTVTGWFGRMLGKPLSFLVKVLGVQEVIRELVKLGGQIGHVFATAGTWLYNAGKDIIQGLWDGLTKKWEAVVGWFKGIKHTIASMLGLGGGSGGTTGGSGGTTGVLRNPNAIPEEKRMAVGNNGGAGGGGRSLSSAFAPTQTVSQKFQQANRDIARWTSEIAQLQRRQEDASNQQALSSAVAAVQTARQKGDGVKQAELDLAQAQEQIRQTSLQRDIDARTKQASVYQTQLDRMKAAADKWNTMMQAARDKAVTADQAFIAKLAANLDTARTRLGAQYDRLATQIMAAFQRIQNAWVSKSQQILDATAAQRQHEDLVTAVDDSAQALLDAQDALSQMVNDGTSTGRDIQRQQQTIIGLQRAYQRAQEDLANEGLAAQAAIEKQGHDDQVAVEQQNLEDTLARIRGQMLLKGTTIGEGTKQINGVIKGFNPDFKATGDLLGGSFGDALIAQIRVALVEADKLRAEAAQNRVLSQAARDIPGFVGGQYTGFVPSFAAGGPTGQGGLALLHPGEFVVPAGGALVSGGGSGSAVFNITVNGGADGRMTAYEIRDELLKIKRREPDIFG